MGVPGGLGGVNFSESRRRVATQKMRLDEGSISHCATSIGFRLDIVEKHVLTLTLSRVPLTNEHLARVGIDLYRMEWTNVPGNGVLVYWREF